MHFRLPWRIILSIMIMNNAIHVYSQNPVAEGANSIGLSDTTIWSTSSNPATLTSLARPVAGFGARNSFLIPSLNSYYASTAFRVPKSVVVVDMQYHGFSVWKESSVGVGVARALNAEVSLSAKLTYMHVNHGNETPSNGYFAPQIFANIKTNDNSHFHVQLSPAVWLYDNTLPVRAYPLSIGADYRFSPQLMAYSDGALPEKGIIRISVGGEYSVSPNCTFRIGVATDDYPLAAGLSVGKDVFGIDISYRYHRYLGAVVACGLRISI